MNEEMLDLTKVKKQLLAWAEKWTGVYTLIAFALILLSLLLMVGGKSALEVFLTVLLPMGVIAVIAAFIVLMHGYARFKDLEDKATNRAIEGLCVLTNTLMEHNGGQLRNLGIQKGTVRFSAGDLHCSIVPENALLIVGKCFNGYVYMEEFKCTPNLDLDATALRRLRAWEVKILQDSGGLERELIQGGALTRWASRVIDMHDASH